MIFTDNLEEIVFTRHQKFECDELIILSGYVGPTPVHRLGTLPIKSTVIYGMFGSDGIQKRLHDSLLSENTLLNNVEIFYSSIPVHSKIYIWRKKKKVVHALVGSANFTTNGLSTPSREVLTEMTTDGFNSLNEYIKSILENAINCEDVVACEIQQQNSAAVTSSTEYNKDVCSMPLFIKDHGVPVVPQGSGLNWGMSKLNGSHVNINDAYIRIDSKQLELYPNLFPRKQVCPMVNTETGRKRHNDNVEILWDDGVDMTGLLEGSIPKTVDGAIVNYPKQISSTPSKSNLGKYLRKRIGVEEGVPITYDDLLSYGRTTVDVSLQGEGIYFFDFSVK